MVCHHGQGPCCCREGFWLLCGGRLADVVCRQGACFSKNVAAAWRAFGRHGLSSWAGPLLLCGGFLAAVWRALADVVRWHGQGSGC